MSAKAKKLPSGNWRCLAYSHTDENKKRIYESFTAETKAEAEYMAAEFAMTKRNKKRPGNMTVGEAIDKYISAKDSVLSPTTVSAYKKIRKNNLGGLMSVTLSGLSNELVQSEINREVKRVSPRTKKPLTAKTVRNIYGLLSAALSEYAPDIKLKVTLPSKGKKIIELPPVQDIINAIRGTEIELPCLLAIWMSYSMSEIRGIKVSSISDSGYIIINNVVVTVDNEHVEKNKPKTYARTRRAELPPYIIELIKQQPSYIEHKKTGQDSYLIPYSGNAIYKRFMRILEAKGLPHISFHKLRHVNASVMLQLGIPDKYAMERGGWSSPHVMKNVYQHTYSDERKAVDGKINDYFSNMIEH